MGYPKSEAAQQAKNNVPTTKHAHVVDSTRNVFGQGITSLGRRCRECAKMHIWNDIATTSTTSFALTCSLTLSIFGAIYPVSVATTMELHPCMVPEVPFTPAVRTRPASSTSSSAQYSTKKRAHHPYLILDQAHFPR